MDGSDVNQERLDSSTSGTTTILDTVVIQERDDSIASSIQSENSTFRTVSQLLRHRAVHFPNHVAIAYPSSGTQYVNYTMQDLDVFAYRTCQYYEKSLPHRRSSDLSPAVVGLLGVSDLEYAITMLALLKMGHTPLLLSTRISAEAVTSLLRATKARTLVIGERFTSFAAGVQEQLADVQLIKMVCRGVFEFPVEENVITTLDETLDMEVETLNNAFIIHSSGSTGFPKPIYQSHVTALANYAMNMNMRGFITLPLFHNHGLCNFFRAIHSGKSLHMYNAQLPLASEHLLKVMMEHSFEIFYGVPYALKLLAESPHGLKQLSRFEVVMFGGSACPDELGHMLVEAGVQLVSHYGATEVGQVMTSFRPPGDTAWNYVRESAKLKPHIRWIPRGANLFECVITNGWSAKNTSNQPDGSYQTKDLFEPHPTIPGAWKYIARLDDTLTLITGEKFSPVPLEGTVRSNSAVKECAVFGAGRPYLGILVVPSALTLGQSEEQITNLLWPLIENANKSIEAYARISKDLIKILPHDIEYPRTDKGSIIRQAFYKKFEAEISDTYDVSEARNTASHENLENLEPQELGGLLADAVQKVLNTPRQIGLHEDFFSLGMDSLQAIQLRGIIVQNFHSGPQKLGQNVAFDYPTIQKMVTHLLALRAGEDAVSVDVEAEMEALVEKYSTHIERKSKAASTVVLTGVTGSLGAHIAQQLCKYTFITRIYCLVRAETLLEADRRMKESLVQRRVYHDTTCAERTKLVALPFDQTDAQLGLSENIYEEVTRDLHSVIHCAWAVNFNLKLASFERDCVAGVRNLISLCRATVRAEPTRFIFCSSVSTMSRCPISPVPEALPKFSWAQDMGYAQSKAVAEHMCLRAAKDAGVDARVLRIGQIVADTREGVWNTTEAVTMILQTAVTVGALPRISESPSWLPVDTVAQVVCEITFSDIPRRSDSRVFNIVNSRRFHWTEDLLPALRTSGLEFEDVEPREWIKRLRDSNTDPVINPPIKLLSFLASKYDKDDVSEGITYATSEACTLSGALANAPLLDQAFVDKFVHYLVNEGWKPKTS